MLRPDDNDTSPVSLISKYEAAYDDLTQFIQSKMNEKLNGQLKIEQEFCESYTKLCKDSNGEITTENKLQRQKLMESHINLIKLIEQRFTKTIMKKINDLKPEHKQKTPDTVSLPSPASDTNIHGVSLTNHMININSLCSINQGIQSNNSQTQAQAKKEVITISDDDTTDNIPPPPPLEQNKDDVKMSDEVIEYYGVRLRINDGAESIKCVCVHCNKVYIQVKEFREHNKKEHNDEKPFHCHYDGCNHRSARRYDFKKHVERVHDKIINFYCKVCNKGFYSKVTCDNHYRTHTGEKPYECPYEECKKRFGTLGSYKDHVNVVHKKIKPFKCQDCGHCFGRKSKLKEHRDRIHLLIKRHECDYCGQRFAKRYSMLSHRRLHTGERPYECKDCGKGFRDTRLLSKHRRKDNCTDDEYHKF